MFRGHQYTTILVTMISQNITGNLGWVEATKVVFSMGVSTYQLRLFFFFAGVSGYSGWLVMQIQLTMGKPPCIYQWSAMIISKHDMIPSGNWTQRVKMAIYSIREWVLPVKMWFSLVLLVYRRVSSVHIPRYHMMLSKDWPWWFPQPVRSAFACQPRCWPWRECLRVSRPQ